MKIKKLYSENVNLGNYENARVGIEITVDKDIKSPEQLEKVSNGVLKLAKNIVRKELEGIKTERGG